MNEAVITTKYVLEQKSKVVYVFHSEEGWEFYGKEKDVNEEDARIVSLGNILEKNPHLVDILWISEGMEAWINNEKNEWQVGVANQEE